MTLDRAITLQNRGTTALTDCYSAARSFGLLSAQMEARRHDTLARIGVNAKAPRWLHSYLDGYWRALISQAYQSDLVYGAMVNGEFRSTHRNRPDYYEKHGLAPSIFADDSVATAKGHYWSTTLKPFFTGPHTS